MIEKFQTRRAQGAGPACYRTGFCESAATNANLRIAQFPHVVDRSA